LWRVMLVLQCNGNEFLQAGPGSKKADGDGASRGAHYPGGVTESRTVDVSQDNDLGGSRIGFGECVGELGLHVFARIRLSHSGSLKIFQFVGELATLSCSDDAQ